MYQPVSVKNVTLIILEGLHLFICLNYKKNRCLLFWSIDNILSWWIKVITTFAAVLDGRDINLKPMIDSVIVSIARKMIHYLPVTFRDWKSISISQLNFGHTLVMIPMKLSLQISSYFVFTEQIYFFDFPIHFFSN